MAALVLWIGLFGCNVQAQTSPIPKEATARELMQSGVQAMEAGRHQDAVELFNAAVQRNPKIQGVWNLLGRSYTELGMAREAEAALRRQIQIDRFDPEAYNLLGTVLLQQGRQKDAEAAFRQQIEISPLHAEAHGNLAHALLQMGRAKETVAVLERATQIDPKNVELRLMLGLAYAQAGDAAKADAIREELKTESSLDIDADVFEELLASAARSPEDALEIAVQETSRLTNLMRDLKVEAVNFQQVEGTAMLVTSWAIQGDAHLRRNELPLAETYLAVAWKWTNSGYLAELLGRLHEKRQQTSDAIKFYRYASEATPPRARAKARLEELGALKPQPRLKKRSERELGPNEVPVSDDAVEVKGTADFITVFTAEGKVKAARWLRGEPEFRRFERMLPSLDYTLPLPPANKAELVRVGTLSCEVRCQFYFWSPNRLGEAVTLLSGR